MNAVMEDQQNNEINNKIPVCESKDERESLFEKYDNENRPLLFVDNTLNNKWVTFKCDFITVGNVYELNKENNKRSTTGIKLSEETQQEINNYLRSIDTNLQKSFATKDKVMIFQQNGLFESPEITLTQATKIGNAVKTIIENPYHWRPANFKQEDVGDALRKNNNVYTTMQNLPWVPDHQQPDKIKIRKEDVFNTCEKCREILQSNDALLCNTCLKETVWDDCECTHDNLENEFTSEPTVCQNCSREHPYY